MRREQRAIPTKRWCAVSRSFYLGSWDRGGVAAGDGDRENATTKGFEIQSSLRRPFLPLREKNLSSRIRDLIERNLAELERHGVCVTAPQTL